MLLAVISFADLLLGALLTGAMFGAWLSFNPTGLNPTAYVLQWQHGSRTLHPLLPILGGITILLTLISAWLNWSDRTRFVVLLAGALSYAVAGLITRLVNLPINAVVLTWSAEAPPANWGRMRDRWWHWHQVRTAAAVCGLCLLIIAAVEP
jgi:anthrone oxygenase-like protein